MRDQPNIVGKNASRESNLSPSDVGINFMPYEVPPPMHARNQANPMDPMRANEFREILNTAVQAAQPDRQMQRQPETLGILDYRCCLRRWTDVFVCLFAKCKLFWLSYRCFLDADEIFAETDSNDASATRPARQRANIPFYPRWPNAVEISDEEIEAVIFPKYTHYTSKYVSFLIQITVFVYLSKNQRQTAAHRGCAVGASKSVAQPAISTVRNKLRSSGTNDASRTQPVRSAGEPVESVSPDQRPLLQQLGAGRLEPARTLSGDALESDEWRQPIRQLPDRLVSGERRPVHSIPDVPLECVSVVARVTASIAAHALAVAVWPPTSV